MQLWRSTGNQFSVSMVDRWRRMMIMRRGFPAVRAAKCWENWLHKSTSPDIFKNKHLLGKKEERSMQPWDNKTWFSVVSDVRIPTQVLEEMETQRCPVGPGCCTMFLTFLWWIIFVGPLEISLVPMTVMLPTLFPPPPTAVTAPSPCLQTHTTGCAIPAAGQLFTSCLLRKVSVGNHHLLKD